VNCSMSMGNYLWNSSSIRIFNIYLSYFFKYDKEDEHDQQCRYLLRDNKDSSSSGKSKEKEDIRINIDVKKVISIRTEHLLNISLTKTTLDLGQRIQIMFNSAYKKKNHHQMTIKIC